MANLSVMANVFTLCLRYCTGTAEGESVTILSYRLPTKVQRQHFRGGQCQQRFAAYQVVFNFPEMSVLFVFLKMLTGFDN